MLIFVTVIGGRITPSFTTSALCGSVAPTGVVRASRGPTSATVQQ